MFVRQWSWILVAVVVSACTAGGPTATAGSSQAAVSPSAAASAASAAPLETYVIGVDTAQTGYLAPFDQPALRGLQLGVDEINASGGLAGKYRIELRIKDMKTDAAQGAIVARELLNEGAKLLIAPCDADPAIAAGRIAQAAEIPAISFCASTPTVTAAVGNYMFSNYSADNYVATALADYAIEKGYRGAYLLVSPDSAYTAALPQYFGQVFTAKGGAIVGEETYTLDQQDFGVAVTKIRGLNPQPDVIMSSMYEPQFPAFIKQLRGAGITIPMLENDSIDTSTVLELGSVIEGVVFTSAGVATPGSALEAFYGKFEQKYGEKPDAVYAAIGYDLSQIIKAAVEKADTTDPAAVRDALANLENVPGVFGNITFKGTNGIPIRPIALATFQNGERVLIKNVTPDPATVPAP